MAIIVSVCDQMSYMLVRIVNGAYKSAQVWTGTKAAHRQQETRLQGPGALKTTLSPPWYEEDESRIVDQSF